MLNTKETINNRILDLSGFMFSGKSAVSDLLREFDGFYVHNYRTEFDLLRIGGGLIDLKNSVMDWSPVRSYAALCRFEKIMRQLAVVPKFPIKYFKTGFGYLDLYPNLLSELDKFIYEITGVMWKTPWPYEDLVDDYIPTFIRKLKSKMGKYTNRDYLLLSKEKFINAAQTFTNNILWSGVNKNKYYTNVIHNALEPFSPGENIDLLGNGAKCIVVDRDPRDIYATAITTQPGFNDNLQYYKRIAGAHDIDVFIKRYQIYHTNIAKNEINVLRIDFEDLLYKYDQTLKTIYNFLDVSSAIHIKKREYFDPEKSKKTSRLWEKKDFATYQSDFKKIEKFCHV